jgi:hypothetical protein
MFKRLAVTVLSSIALPAGIAQAAPPSGSVKDWEFQRFDNGSAIASTGNGTGSSLGVYCVAKRNCSIYLATDTGCEDGQRYTLLLNASTAAYALNSTCRGISSPGEKQHFVFFLEDFDAIIATMMKEHTVGFAIPIAGGEFKVARFSLEGSNEAIAAVSSLLEDAKPKPALNSDQVL